ncbi:hypothetical protein SLA2020_194420 [Shorea laevis]
MPPEFRLLQFEPIYLHNMIGKFLYDHVYVTNMPLFLCISDLPLFHSDINKCLGISSKPYISPAIFNFCNHMCSSSGFSMAM